MNDMPHEPSAGHGTNGSGATHDPLIWPEFFLPVWDRLDPVAQSLLMGPRNDDPNLDHRAITAMGIEVLRQRGLAMEQAIEVAVVFPEGLGFLRHYPGGIGKLIRELWEEQDAETAAEAELEAKLAEQKALEPRIIRLHQLEGLPVPPREWIIDGWLPVGVATGIYGDGGTGKTLLSQQLQASASCRHRISFAGMAVPQCKSFGVYCEDSDKELHRRQADINDIFGIGWADLADMACVSGRGDDWTLANFMTDGRMVTTDRWDWLVREVRAFGARLVPLDTAADMFGGNENDRGQVRKFIRLLASLAEEINGAVTLNCHPSRTGLASGDLDGGSTGWHNTFRSRWTLHRPSGDDVPLMTPERVLTKRKANYGTIGDAIKLRWTKGVLVPDSARQSSGAYEAAAVELVFIVLLDRCEADGRRLSNSSHSANYAPKVFSQRPDAVGHSTRDFERAMQALFIARRIRMEGYGRPGDARQRIVRTPWEEPS
jgi:RecA-family ATPase